MDKITLIQGIKELAAKNEIKREEVIAAYESGSNLSTAGTAPTTDRPNALAKILYFIGGFIVILGIVILIVNNWARLDFATQVLATIGSSIAAYIVGILLNQNEKTSPIAQPFFLIYAIAFPLGLYIIFDHMGYNVHSAGLQSVITGFLFLIFLLSFFVFRYTIFILLTLFFGTGFVFNITDYMIAGNPYFAQMDFYSYRVLLTGIVYILFGYHYAQQHRHALTEFLYSIGILLFLGAAFALMDWKPQQNLTWELLYPVLLALTILLSVFLRSVSFLIFGTLFLVAYIAKITSEYFVNNLGWPLALVIIGFIVIVIGYFSLMIHHRFLSRKTV